MKKKLNYYVVILFLVLLFFSCKTTESIDSDLLSDEHFSYTSDEFVLDKNTYLKDRTLEDDVNGSYPEKIYIKTLTQTFSKEYNFILIHGKIYVKKNSDKRWTLFKGTGLPYSESKLLGKEFETPDYIVEIYADCDSLFAFDNEGRLYTIYLQKATITPANEWINVFGWPDKVPLVQNELVKNKRGWAMAGRRKDILWYEDRFGNQHHYGTMGLETLYFLSENGQEIRFTDSGLPVGFGKSIQGPEHGSFISRNISASGSTIFLIGDDGTMYTRLIDFDTMGCDPMFFKYTYKEEKQKYKGDDYRSNFTKWGLPNEDWKKEPSIKLEGNARLTRFISIHQNGLGNFSRELRVAGTDKNGNVGFYYKQLSDLNWSFYKTNLKFRENDYLTGNKQRGKKTELSYSGYLIENSTKNEYVSCSIDDFSLACEGVFHLKLKMKKDGWEEEKSIKMYNVEMWTYIPMENPGFDGTAKSYFVTPVCPEETLECKHAEMTNLLKQLFLGADRELFIYTIKATTDYIQLEGKNHKKEKFTFFLDKNNLGLNPDAYKNMSVIQQSEVLYFDDVSLILEDNKTYSKNDIPLIENKITRNKEYIILLKKQLGTFKNLKKDTNLSRWGYNILDLLTSITFLDKIDFPKIKTVTSFGDRIMNTNAKNFNEMYKYRHETYPYIIELVKYRIVSYECLINKIKEEDYVYVGKLVDSYVDIFSTLGIPPKLEGKILGNKNINAILSYHEDAKIFPMLSLVLFDDDDMILLLIELKDVIEKIYPLTFKHSDYSIKEGLYKKAIKIDVVYHRALLKSDDVEKKLNIKKLKKGTLIWDGEKLILTKKINSFMEKAIFDSTELHSK